MVTVGETVMASPVPAEVPPHEPEYQSHVAPEERTPETESVEEDPAHIAAGNAFAAVEFDGIAVTLTETL